MNISARVTAELGRRMQLLEQFERLSEEDPCGWGVLANEGPGLFDFSVRLDPDVPQGLIRVFRH